MAALVPAVPTLSWGSDIDYEFSVSLGVSHAIPCFMGLLAFVFSGFIAFFLFKHPDVYLNHNLYFIIYYLSINIYSLDYHQLQK